MKLTAQTFLLRIDVENAAFEDAAGFELARMLRDLADMIEPATVADMANYQNLRNVNGNIVGAFAVKDAGYET